MKFIFPQFCALCLEGPLFGTSVLCSYCATLFDHHFLIPRSKLCDRVRVHSLYGWREEDELVSKLVYLIKESRSLRIHKSFAQRIVGHVPVELFREAVLLPIPSSTGRRHSELLAEALGVWTGLEVVKALELKGGAERQPGKSKEDRKSRRIEFKSDEIKRFLLSYKTVVLIDDVLTTGSTMEAASRALESFQSLYGVTLFRRDLSTKFATY